MVVTRKKSGGKTKQASIVRNIDVERIANEIHRQARVGRFKRRPVIVLGFDETWQADLVDVSKLRKSNKNIPFILTVIDVFSKFAFVRQLPSKHGSVVANAFESIFTESGRCPKYVFTKNLSVKKQNKQNNQQTFLIRFFFCLENFS